MKMKSTKIIALVAISLTTALAGRSEAAVELNSILLPGINTAQDQDFERVLRLVNGVETYVTGPLQVGDILEAALSFDTANTLSLKNVHFTPNYQLTAWSRIIVESITPTSPGLANFVFRPGIDTNTAVELWESPLAAPLDFVAPDDADTSIANARTGTLVATFGFQDTDDFWIALGAPTDTGLLTNTVPGEAVPGSFAFGLSMLTNPGGLDLVDEGTTAKNLLISSANIPVDLGGGGSLKGKPANVLGPDAGGWHVETDTSVNFRAVGFVPEPASLVAWAVLAMASGSVAFAARRRK